MVTFISIIIAIFVFGVIVLIHELGHFISAKKFGVKVNEFAIGMGPTLFKVQKGETKYSLRLFPIGGFCAMEGEDSESESEDSFGKKSIGKRMIIIVAGAFMNLVLGFVLMLILLGQQSSFSTNVIEKFADDSITQQSGLKVNDEILSIDGYSILTMYDLRFKYGTNKTYKADFVVKRDGQKVEIKDIKLPTKDVDGKTYAALDFQFKPESKNFFTLISKSFNACVSNVRIVWSSLGGLITGKFSIKEMSGPVGITSAITQAASQSFTSTPWVGINNLLSLMMMITINLGVMNLLPVPALDGGRLLFLIIEAIRRKPIHPKYEGYIHLAGFVILLLFIVFVSYLDVLKFFR